MTNIHHSYVALCSVFDLSKKQWGVDRQGARIEASKAPKGWMWEGFFSLQTGGGAWRKFLTVF